MSKKLFSIVVISMAIALIAAFPQAAAAQTGFNMSIFPAKVELTVAPQTTQNFTVNLRNFGPEPQNIKVYFNDYLITANNDFVFQPPGHYSYSCAKWLTAAAGTMVVAPGSTGSMAFSVTVPQGAEPGGHYAVIFFEQIPPASAGQVTARPRLGSLVLVTVPGTIVREGRIKKVTVSSTWFWPPVKLPLLPASPNKVRVEFYNAGNVHLTVRGHVSYKPSFGWGHGVVDLGEITVLPKTTRYMDADLSQKPEVAAPGSSAPQASLPGPAPGSTRPLIGTYDVQATLEYGPSMDVFDTKKTAKTSFNNYPLSIVLIVLIIVGIVIGLVYLRRWRRRRKAAGGEAEQKVPEEKAGEATAGTVNEAKKVDETGAAGEVPSGSGEGD